MDLYQGFTTFPNALSPAHVTSLQVLAETCWNRQLSLLQEWPDAAVYISGQSLQIDVDRCAEHTKTRKGSSFFHSLLAPYDSNRDPCELLLTCQQSYDAYYEDKLVPLGRSAYGPEMPLFRQKGRKLLLSTRADSSEQLPHMDSLHSTLVGNVYLHQRGSECLPIRATHIAREPGLPFKRFPRSFSATTPALELSFGACSVPWCERDNVAPEAVEHNSSIVFFGNVVHWGPFPEQDCLRIVAFQYLRPETTPEEDLSDFQMFEWSLYNDRYGAEADCTGEALARSEGRWKEHYADHEEKEFISLLRAERRCRGRRRRGVDE